MMYRVGNNAYLACPKGQLTAGHILITPVVHRQNTLKLPAEAVEEMEKYKMALVKSCLEMEMKCRMFRAQGKSLLIWERNLTTRNPLHCHLQVVPIEASKGISGIPIIPQKTSLKSYWTLQLLSGGFILPNLQKWVFLEFHK